MAGTMVGLLLGGAAIHSYLTYLSDKLYRQDSFKLKSFLHVVMALAVVSRRLGLGCALRPQPAPSAPSADAPGPSPSRGGQARRRPRKPRIQTSADPQGFLPDANRTAVLWGLPLRDVSPQPSLRHAPSPARADPSPLRSWQARDANTLFGQTVTDCLCLTFVGVEGALVQLFLAQRGTTLMGRSRWRWLYWLFVGAGVLGGAGGLGGVLGCVAGDQGGQGRQLLQRRGW